MKSHRYKELRFKLYPDFTAVYVQVETVDGLVTCFAWRYKAFDKNLTVLEIVRSFGGSEDNADPINWPESVTPA